MFDEAAPAYQEALSKSGYKHTLVFNPSEKCSKNKKTRTRKVTWFNPPFSLNVKTNVGREFLKLIDSAFPPSNTLHKLFNRRTVKVSYRCMPNIAQAVAKHNVQILTGTPHAVQAQPGCNCRGGVDACPVQGRCLVRGVVYRATVTETASGNTETYTGATGNTFKERYNGHKADMRHKKNRHNTTLADYVWDLKEEGKDFNVKWSIVDRATTFNPTTGKCRVCPKEKIHILYNQSGSTLNRRNEIFNTCRHRRQKLLENVKS